MKLVASLAALEAALEQADSGAWTSEIAVPPSGAWGILLATKEGVSCLFHPTDTLATPKVVLVPPDTSVVQSDAWRTVYQRVHRVATLAQKAPLRLPQSWKAYHAGNLVAFFAALEEQG